MTSFWIQTPEMYTSIRNESKEVILHPFLADIINAKNFQRILDYGCGDGSLMKKLNNKAQISLYDNSTKVLKIAEKNLHYFDPMIYTSSKDLPRNYFDCVVLSLVIMTISSEEEIEKVLQNIYQVLNSYGIALIAVTHPCFREYAFSTFHTSYTKENFNYLNNGEPFTVTLEDNLNGNDITFTDYHWTLSHTLNLIIKSKLQIDSIHEIKDKSYDKGYENLNFCPYMVICAQKFK